MTTVCGSGIEYVPSSTCAPVASRDPKSPDAVKKCSWSRGTAPWQGFDGSDSWSTLVTPGIHPSVAACSAANWPRSAAWSACTRSWQVVVRRHAPTSGLPSVRDAGEVTGAVVGLEADWLFAAEVSSAAEHPATTRRSAASATARMSEPPIGGERQVVGVVDDAQPVG